MKKIILTNLGPMIILGLILIGSDRSDSTPAPAISVSSTLTTRIRFNAAPSRTDSLHTMQHSLPGNRSHASAPKKMQWILLF